MACSGALEDIMELLAWVDVYHATRPDILCPVSGEAVILDGRGISWFARAQKVTATSSSESVFLSLNEVLNGLRSLCRAKAFLVPLYYPSVTKAQSRWL